MSNKKDQINLSLFSISIITGSTIYLSLPREPSITLLSILIIFSIFLLFFLKKNKIITFYIIIILLEIFISSYRTSIIGKQKFINKKKFVPNLEAKILDINKYPMYSNILINVINDSKLPSYARITVRQPSEHLNIGDIIKASVVMLPLSETTYPNSKILKYMKKIGATGYSTKNIIVISKNKNKFLINHIRSFIDKKIFQFIDQKHASIASAMITGKKTKIDINMKNDINKSGLAHLLAISGLHMSIISAFIFKSSRGIMSCFSYLSNSFDIKKIAAIFSILISFLYLLLSGHPASAQRAFITNLLFYIAILLDRRPNGKNAMIFAAGTILIYSPENIIQPGFQLSFASVCAIFVVHELFENVKKNFLNKIFLNIVNSTLITIITAPYLIYHFNNVSVIGILTNIVAIPIASYIIIPSGVVMLFFIWNDFIAKRFAIFMQYGIKLLLLVTNIAKDKSTIYFKNMPSIVLLLFSIAIIILFVLENKKSKLYFFAPTTIAILLWCLQAQPSLLLYKNNIMLIDERNNLSLFSGRKNSLVNNWAQKYSNQIIPKKDFKNIQYDENCGYFYTKNNSKVLITKLLKTNCEAELIIETNKREIYKNNVFIKEYYNQPVFVYIKNKKILVKEIVEKKRPWN